MMVNAIGRLKPQENYTIRDYIYYGYMYMYIVWLYRVYMLKCLSCHSLFVMESREKTMEWDKTSKWLMTKTGKNFWYYLYV